MKTKPKNIPKRTWWAMPRELRKQCGANTAKLAAWFFIGRRLGEPKPEGR